MFDRFSENALLAMGMGKSEAQRRRLPVQRGTAEEQGLLGSAYYGENPVHPLRGTVAAINMDDSTRSDR